MELSDMITPSQAAKVMGVTTQAVDYWIAQGELGITRTPWGTRLIERAVLDAFAATRGGERKDTLGRVNGAFHRKEGTQPT